MLRNLHIKNMALIREIDVDFTEGFNVLTGETGAGKSIIIDAIGMALGGRIVRNMLRSDAPYGLVELVFEIDDEETVRELEKYDITPEDGVVLISRKIQETRSATRINGEMRSAAEVREIASLLVDIHGQSEHQKLLRPEHQLSLIDAYGREEIRKARARVGALYRQWQALKSEAGEEEIPKEVRARQMSFLQFEIDEIREAALSEGEDEELERRYKKLLHAQRIASAVAEAHSLTGYDGDGAAGESIGRAIRELDRVSEYDSEVSGLLSSLSEIDDLLNDFNRSLAEYADSLTYDEETFEKTEERLDAINRLKAKYGRTIGDILSQAESKEKELAALEDYEERRSELLAAIAAKEKELLAASEALSALRRKAAGPFAEAVMRELADLNFARSDFEVGFARTAGFTSGGIDIVEFRIATNPGEDLRPLGRVVSGGELSRIMLGIRTMFAAEDATGTLIFDEVDTGISGITAQKVAQKMAVIARHHQVFCVTHLPQIAAMADSHYGITKEVRADMALTKIEPLDTAESEEELARLLGGARVTENTRISAREMKAMCRQFKQSDL